MSTTFSKSLSLLSTRVTQSSSSLFKKPNNNIFHVQKKFQLSSSSFTTTTAITTANAITTATKNNLTVGAFNSSFSKLSFRLFSTEEDKDPDAQWKKFQQTIMYDPTTSPDFETLSKKSKNRGGKMLRKKKEKQEEMMKKQEDRMFDVGTGQFPPLRYSDEETQRLLQEAYAALPQKGISKKTRQKKRQKNRWKLVRRQDRQKKLERIAAHYKKMEERSRRVKDVLAVKAGAEEVRVNDREYQMSVLRKWALMNGKMVIQEEGSSSSSSDSGDVIEEAGKKQEL